MPKDINSNKDLVLLLKPITSNQKFDILTWKAATEKDSSSNEEPLILNLKNKEFYFYSKALKFEDFSNLYENQVVHLFDLDKNQQTKIKDHFNKNLSQTELFERNMLLKTKSYALYGQHYSFVKDVLNLRLEENKLPKGDADKVMQNKNKLDKIKLKNLQLKKRIARIMKQSSWYYNSYKDLAETENSLEKYTNFLLKGEKYNKRINLLTQEFASYSKELFPLKEVKELELPDLDVEELLKEMPSTSSSFGYNEIFEDVNLKKRELETQDNLEKNSQSFKKRKLSVTKEQELLDADFAIDSIIRDFHAKDSFEAHAREQELLELDAEKILKETPNASPGFVYNKVIEDFDLEF